VFFDSIVASFGIYSLYETVYGGWIMIYSICFIGIVVILRVVVGPKWLLD